jgi:hypothetical protein
VLLRVPDAGADLRGQLAHRGLAGHLDPQWRRVRKLPEDGALLGCLAIEQRNSQNHLVCAMNSGQIGREYSNDERIRRAADLANPLDRCGVDPERVVVGATRLSLLLAGKLRG